MVITGNLSDLILDLGVKGMTSLEYEQKCKNIRLHLSLALLEGDDEGRFVSQEALNNFLEGKLVRGYIEDGNLYLSLRNKDGELDTYHIDFLQNAKSKKQISFEMERTTQP